MNKKDTNAMLKSIQKSKRKVDCSSIEIDQPYIKYSPQIRKNLYIEWEASNSQSNPFKSLIR